MIKNIFCVSGALLLSACGSSDYPAAQSASASNGDTAALVGQVLGALTTPQTQNPTTPQHNALGTLNQSYGQNPQTLASLLNAVDGQGQLSGIVQSVLVNQCGAYIRNQSLWRTARLALGNQAQRLEAQVCQCTTQDVMNNMTAEQLTQLGMNALGGQTTLSKATTNLLSQTAMRCLRHSLGQNGMTQHIRQER